MIVYTYKTKYSSDTGEPKGIKIDKKIRYCDWSGETWGGEDCPFARFTFHYEMLDPCFGSGGIELEFARSFDVEMHKFFDTSGMGGGPFVIKSPYEKEAKEAFCESDVDSFDIFLRHQRVKTARQLIEEDEIKAYNVYGFYPDPTGLTIEEWEEIQNSF